LSSPPPIRIAWAVSGQGRALQAILDAVDLGLLPVEIVALVVDRPSPIEAVAQARGLPCRLLQPGPERYHPELAAMLTEHRAEWLGLTFNRLLSDDVIALLGGRIFNLHLSLLPMFPCFGSIPRALSGGLRLTGATVHLIDGKTDQGTILAQSAVPLGGRDTREILGRRLFEASLPLLLQVVRSVGTGELQVDPRDGLRWPRTDIAPEGPTATFPLVDADLVQFARGFCARLA
jgi:phosphoribosylglycinamide formyltransferase 1